MIKLSGALACLATLQGAVSAAHVRGGAAGRRTDPRGSLPEAASGVRIYQDVGQGVELGVHHPSSIDMAAGAASHAGRAARAYLSKQSGTGMTGGDGTGPRGAAHGTLDTFDYQGFSDKVDAASEHALDGVMGATRAALDASRKEVLAEHGLTTGGTGGSATGGDATAAASGGTGPADEVVAATAGATAEEGEETSAATGGDQEEEAAATGPLSPEELVERLRAEEKGEPVPTGPTGDAAADATGGTDEGAGDDDVTAEDETAGATGETGGATGETGSATGETGGGDGHWKWIHASHAGNTLKRHMDLKGQ